MREREREKTKAKKTQKTWDFLKNEQKGKHRFNYKTCPVELKKKNYSQISKFI